MGRCPKFSKTSCGFKTCKLFLKGNPNYMKIKRKEITFLSRRTWPKPKPCDGVVCRINKMQKFKQKKIVRVDIKLILSSKKSNIPRLLTVGDVKSWHSWLNELSFWMSADSSDSWTCLSKLIWTATGDPWLRLSFTVTGEPPSQNNLEKKND